MSPTELLLPPESDVLITEMTMTENLLVVVATPLTTSAFCSLCGSTSDQTHSRYRRTVADLPFGDRSLVVRLMPTEPEPVVRCLGIDDFAFRRGHDYGTMPP